MTRPVYEPTPDRTDAALGYGNDQLFRRPAPAGNDELPWARRSRGFAAAAQTITTASTTDVLFTNSYNMGAGQSGEDFFSASGSNAIILLTKGIYLFQAYVVWAVTMNNVHWGMGLSGATPDLTQNTTEGQGAFTESMSFCVIHRFPVNTQASLTVWQTSGISKDLDAAYLEITRIGSYTGTEWTSMDPDQ